jgi:hypothetical protein
LHPECLPHPLTWRISSTWSGSEGGAKQTGWISAARITIEIVQNHWRWLLMLKMNYIIIRVNLTGCGSLIKAISFMKRNEDHSGWTMDTLALTSKRLGSSVAFNRTLCEPSKMSKKPASSAQSDKTNQ